MPPSISVVIPAYNAERTLQTTVSEIPSEIVDAILLVDDGSCDNTVSLAMTLGISTFAHNANYGYGRNQKTCYNEALKLGADVAVMLHPDYQYTPRLITAMASMIAFDVFDVVLGSRVLGGSALAGGMPRYKYVSNRLLLSFKISCNHRSSRSSTPATGPTRVRSSPHCRLWKIRTILPLTTKY